VAFVRRTIRSLWQFRSARKPEANDLSYEEILNVHINSDQGEFINWKNNYNGLGRHVSQELERLLSCRSGKANKNVSTAIKTIVYSLYWILFLPSETRKKSFKKAVSSHETENFIAMEISQFYICETQHVVVIKLSPRLNLLRTFDRFSGITWTHLTVEILLDFHKSSLYRSRHILFA
jgi:hypothetical protein